MKILGLIPARGGSKGVPRKNIVPLAGKPLLGWTAEAALGAQKLSRVILSTEDEEIAGVGRHCGLEVPFMRPEALARDETPSIDVVMHALAWLENRGDCFDAVCLLQPTNPLRTSKSINQACEYFEDASVDTLVSVLPIPHHYHPDWSMIRRSDGTMKWTSGSLQPPPRRQDLPDAFHRDGSIYLVRWNALVENKSLYGARMAGWVAPEGESVNIDRPEDLSEADRILKNRGTDDVK